MYFNSTIPPVVAMTCPNCGALLAHFRDLLQCNICGFKIGPHGTNPGRPFAPPAQACQVVLVEDAAVKVETKRRKPRSAYRSKFKKQIKDILLNHPFTSHFELCRKLDENGCELPDGYEEFIRLERSFEAAYKHPRLRGRLHKAFSQVRADMIADGQI